MANGFVQSAMIGFFSNECPECNDEKYVPIKGGMLPDDACSSGGFINCPKCKRVK